MKKLFAAVAAVAAFSAHAGDLSVAATPVPHAEILEFVKPALAKEGVNLKVKVFTDYIQPNVQVAEKRLDANFFQHQPYLDEFNKAKGTHLVSVAAVHLEPLGAYSSKYKKLDEIKDGSTVVIPNDATNGGRALLLLDKAGLKEGARYLVFHCADTLDPNAPPALGRYYESIDLIDAYHPQSILAYDMNGAPLAVKHGAPVRLRVERQLGYKHAKYVMRIEAVADLDGIGGGKGGFWEDRGYEWYAGI